MSFALPRQARRGVALLALAVALVAAVPAAALPRRSLPATGEPSDRQAAEIARIAKPRSERLAARPATADIESTAGSAAPSSGEEPVSEPAVRGGARGTGSPSREAFLPGFADRQSAEIVAQNYGRGNANTVYQYTDLKVPTDVVKDYPYRAAGYFYFQAQDNVWYWCTASLISNSILVTAGHCVHDGGNTEKGWIKQGFFYPARSKDAYPYGRAKTRELFTTDGWYSGGKLDRGYDVGLVVLDIRANTNREIGADTGYLGFCHKNCLSKYWFLSALGYPYNYYNGKQMSQGHHLGKSDGADFEFGSGMEGGSSGGPQVANLGELDSSGAKSDYATRNVVFAVTSWGYNNANLKIQGASPLSGPNNNNGFKQMYNEACTEARRLHGKNSCDPL